MKYKGAAALFVLAAMMLVPMASVSAEDTYADIPISEPPEGSDSMEVGVYFADNMAFTPQWRLGNFIRIEIIILDVTDLADPSELLLSETNVYTQEELRATPDLIFDTNMVSVSEIWINITSEDGTVVVDWHSDFVDPDGERTVIREINGEGHLIYGGKWDTSTLPEGIGGGFFTVSVGLPSVYDVKWSLQHERAVEEDPVEEPSLESDDVVEEPAEAIGYMLVPPERGGVVEETNEAYLVLGEILEGSGSGANGGDGGQSDGGNCYHGGKK